jgi:hypothetical protein
MAAAMERSEISVAVRLSGKETKTMSKAIVPVTVYPEETRRRFCKEIWNHICWTIVNRALYTERRVFKLFEQRIKEIAFDEQPDMKVVKEHCKRIYDIHEPFRVKEAYGPYHPRKSTLCRIRWYFWDPLFSHIPFEFTSEPERQNSVTSSEESESEAKDDDESLSTSTRSTETSGDDNDEEEEETDSSPIHVTL